MIIMMLYYGNPSKTHPKNDDRMLGWVLLEKVAKGNRASREDDFVSLDLFSPITGDSHVHKLRLVPQVCEGCLDALLEVVPSQAKLLV